jgi:alkylhydroperoxidase family enzyme
MNQLSPLNPPFDPEVARLLETYPRRDGYLLSLFRVFALSPRFLRKGVANLLDRDSPLVMREREVVILRVTANRGCEYEWGVHVAAFADHVGLDRRAVSATLSAVQPDGLWTDREALLIRVVDELCADGTLEGGTSTRFAATFTLAEQLEILALAGNYHTVSFVANVARLPAEPFAARFTDYADLG